MGDLYKIKTREEEKKIAIKWKEVKGGKKIKLGKVENVGRFQGSRLK